jgi:transcriptional regulator with XRE-family HTH domain
VEFWDLFDYLCAKKGVSRRKACEEMGFSTSLASKARYAQTKPKTEFVYACSQYFGVTIDYLMGKEDAPGKEDTAQLVFENYGLRVLFETSKGVPSSKLMEWAAQIEEWKEANKIVD